MFSLTYLEQLREHYFAQLFVIIVIMWHMYLGSETHITYLFNTLMLILTCIKLLKSSPTWRMDFRPLETLIFSMYFPTDCVITKPMVKDFIFFLFWVLNDKLALIKNFKNSVVWERGFVLVRPLNTNIIKKILYNVCWV